jgi:hypothetical protein
MRMLGGWIALTPELPAKLLMGRHVWDCAQHADAWGKRLPELRAPAQQSEAPSDGVARLLDVIEDLDQPEQTTERLVSIYRVIKPQLLAAYERHAAEANAVYEPPTRRILERCIADERRHVGTAVRIVDHLLSSPALRVRAEACEVRGRAQLAEAGGITGDGDLGPAVVAPMDAPADIAADLLELERPATRWPLPEALSAALARYGDAIANADVPAARASIAADAAEALGAAQDDLGRIAWTNVAVVACARLARHWIVKLRLAAAAGALVLQTRWVETADGWRLAEMEIARRDGLPSA